MPQTETYNISELHPHGLAKISMPTTNVLADKIFDDRNGFKNEQ